MYIHAIWLVYVDWYFSQLFAKQLPDISHYVGGPRHMSQQVKGVQLVPSSLREAGGDTGVILPQIQANKFGTFSGVPSGFSSVLPSHKSTSHGHHLPQVFPDTRAPSKVHAGESSKDPIFLFSLSPSVPLPSLNISSFTAHALLPTSFPSLSTLTWHQTAYHSTSTHTIKTYTPHKNWSRVPRITCIPHTSIVVCCVYRFDIIVWQDNVINLWSTYIKKQAGLKKQQY